MLKSLEKIKNFLTHNHTEHKTTPLPEPAFKILEPPEVKQKTFIYPVALRSREKAYSVKLLDGYVTENPGGVRAKGCGFCQQTPRLVAVNYANPRLVLFGCHKTDCNNKLIRVDTS